MYKVLIQSGHQNTTTSATGAPEEGVNNIRIRDRLGQVLISKGFQVYLVDANFKDYVNDYHLALALHCDANYTGDEGGGFVDYPDPSIDSASAESKRIKEAIESLYFEHSGIRNMPNRSNPNTKFYYWWSYLTAKTPCVILEMGESIDPHDKVILADTNRVANAIARGVCRAFGVEFDTPTIPPIIVEPPVNPEDPCRLLKDELDFEEKLNNDLLKKLSDVRVIIYGKGWVWQRMNQLKVLFPK